MAAVFNLFLYNAFGQLVYVFCSPFPRDNKHWGDIAQLAMYWLGQRWGALLGLALPYDCIVGFG